jgi:hypothetical protein
MRVRIADSVFAAVGGDLGAPDHSALLVELFSFAYYGRHRVQLDDRDSYEQWRSRRDPELATFCDLAIERSDEAEVRIASHHEMIVVDGTARWDAHPPRLPLPTAIEILREKYCLLFEDGDNDFGFLRAVMATPEREELEAREKWWECLHGGGVANLQRKAEELVTRLGVGLHYFVMFDSDARLPNVRSADADRLAATLGDVIPHHCLKRRAVENYATRSVLERWAAEYWADGGGRARVEAFFRLPSPSCRHHFHMKKGLSGDARSGGVASELFDALSETDRSALGQGFSGLRKVLTEQGALRTADLIADESFDELNGLVHRILGMMR